MKKNRKESYIGAMKRRDRGQEEREREGQSERDWMKKKREIGGKKKERERE